MQQTLNEYFENQEQLGPTLNVCESFLEIKCNNIDELFSGIDNENDAAEKLQAIEGYT